MATGHQGRSGTSREPRWLPAEPVPRTLSRRGLALAVLSLAIGCSDGATAPDAPTAPPPPAVTLEIPRQDLVVGERPVEVDLSDHFGHPEGDSLTFAAAVSDTSVASASITAGLLRLAARATGAATVSLTATDPHGSSAATRFAVVVWENSDGTALVALYEATDGPNWVDSENWLTGAPLGAWYGVEVEGSGRVVALDLSGTWDDEGLAEHGLRGAIPPELSGLDSLRALDLSGNALTGPIPSALAHLVRLADVDLADNRLTGAIPPEFGDLAGLEYLDLSGNTLTGAIPPGTRQPRRLEDPKPLGQHLDRYDPVGIGRSGELGIPRPLGEPADRRGPTRARHPEEPEVARPEP